MGNEKLWPRCLNRMEPAGFEFTVYKCDVSNGDLADDLEHMCAAAQSLRDS